MPDPRDRDFAPGPALCAIVLAGIVAICVLVPAIYSVVVSLGGDAPSITPHPAPPTTPVPPAAAGAAPAALDTTLLTALGRTLLAGGAISLLATVIAVPGAWVIRETSPAGARRAALCVGVLMLPNYLAYAGLNLLRAPRALLADWLADHPPWVSVLAGQVIAMLGLALWAWPAAAIALGLALRRLDQDQLDALDLSGAGPVRRARVLARATLPGLAAAFAVVFILMLGSPVPLHVAQFDTYGVALWRRLNQTGDPARTWAFAWPLIAVAALISLVAVRTLSRRLSSDLNAEPSPAAPAISRPARGALGVVFALSLLLPLLLHASATAPPGTTFSLAALTRTIALFWHESSDALLSSAITASLCAAASLTICLTTWAALASPPRRRRSLTRVLALGCAAVLLTALLTPGAVLGSMTAAAWTNLAPLRALADTPLPVVCVHTARFGAVAALLGAWAALLEPPALRDQRELAPPSLAAFARACVRAHWAIPVAAAIAGFVLSLHEIESTVFVQPPGLGNLAQQLLDALHYSRDDRLGAAAITLALASLILAYTGAWLVTRERRPCPDAAPE
jgi:ABC-type Fe3+ transport system permease subunit